MILLVFLKSRKAGKIVGAAIGEGEADRQTSMHLCSGAGNGKEAGDADPLAFPPVRPHSPRFVTICSKKAMVSSS